MASHESPLTAAPRARAAGLPSHRELVEHLVRLVDIRLLDPLEILLAAEAPVRPVRERIRARANEWAGHLLDPDQQAAVGTAARLLAALHPGDEPFNPPAAWWQTPLGRIVARRVGHPTAQAVPYSVAGAMLGITRQGVHDLVTRGKLDRHPDGGVSTASVRDRLNQT
jgi:hypothetical protein